MMPALCTMNAFMHPSVVVAPNDPSLNDSPQDAPQEEDEKIEPLQEDDDFPSLLMSDGLSETSSDAGSKHSLISVSSAVVPPVKSSTGIAGRKRKSTEPHRSVRMPSPSTKMDAIQLNIYAPFRSNPSFLLYTSKTPSKASGRWNRERSVSDAAAAPSPMSHLYSTSAHLSSSSPLTQRPATAKRNFTPANRATKTLPDFVVQGFAATEGEDWELDMSKYQDTKGAPPIQWKLGAQPLLIPDDTPGKEDVTEEELIVCATLRLLPETYLYMKKSLLKAVFTYGPFKKRDAQKWYRMDVNKTSQVYEWFRVLGWIPSSTQEWNERVEEHKRERRASASTQSVGQEDPLPLHQEAIDEDDTGSNISTTDMGLETSSYLL